MQYSIEQYAIAAGLTLFAGLATGIGSAIAFFARRTNYRFLSVALSFSAGVMLYVSFTEILQKANLSLAEAHGERMGGWLAALAFFAGIIFIGIIDMLVPSPSNPHEPRSTGEIDELKHGELPSRTAASVRLQRMGLMAALAIGIHNFPEGMATFFAALDDPKVGMAIAVAIALHNIPEGISVSVPIYYATGSRRKAFQLSFLSGVAEPLGAIIGFALLSQVMTPSVQGVLFGMVAGIMVFISLDELLPAAREYGQGHEILYGIVSGMAVMAASLLLMK